MIYSQMDPRKFIFDAGSFTYTIQFDGTNIVIETVHPTDFTSKSLNIQLISTITFNCHVTNDKTLYFNGLSVHLKREANISQHIRSFFNIDDHKMVLFQDEFNKLLKYNDFDESFDKFQVFFQENGFGQQNVKLSEMKPLVKKWQLEMVDVLKYKNTIGSFIINDIQKTLLIGSELIFDPVQQIVIMDKKQPLELIFESEDTLPEKNSWFAKYRLPNEKIINAINQLMIGYNTSLNSKLVNYKSELMGVIKVEK
jgi:hypothetical protein